MSAQHTPGSIRYDYEPGYCGELIARDGMTVAAFDNEPSEADARRLVACWNACDGISTEHLEDDAVRKMLEALKDCLQRIADDEEYGPDHAVTKARTAIAKAEGGKK